MNSLQKIIATSAIGLLGFGAWSLAPFSREPDIQSQVWLDDIPQDEKHIVEYMLFSQDGGVGLKANGSSFYMEQELFLYEKQNKNITIHFLQSDDVLRSEYKTYRCDGPGGLDLCLEYEDKVYYSAEGLVFESVEEIDANYLKNLDI